MRINLKIFILFSTILLVGCWGIISVPDPLAPTVAPDVSFPTTAPSATYRAATRIAVMVTQTSLPTPKPQENGRGSINDWTRVQIKEISVSFEVPANWEPFGDPGWTPDGGQTVFGARWTTDPKHPEVDAGLLPPNSVMKDKTDLMINNIHVFRFLLSLYDKVGQPGAEAPLVGYEADYLLRSQDGRPALDIYFRVPPNGNLSDLDVIIQHVIGSVKWDQ